MDYKVGGGTIAMNRYLVTIMWRDSSTEQFTVSSNDTRQGLHDRLEACKFITPKMRCVSAIYVQYIKPREASK
jgi:hypothetical protein